MYNLYKCFIQIILSLFLYIIYVLARRNNYKNNRRVFVLLLFANIPFFQYNIFNPLYDGPAFTHLSDNRSPIQGNVVRNWGDTIECIPKKIIKPSSVSEIQEIVTNNSKIRVVGGGHSFSPLVCTEYTLISMEKMNKILQRTDNTVTCEAGSSLKHLITRLLEYDKIIHGFGSIQDQTLAGAFSTSHHGLTFNSFAEDVISISAVLSNGTFFETSDLYYWRSHLGLLGIITSMTINTYPNTQVTIEKSKLSLVKALELLPNADAGIIETNYNQRQDGLLKYITINGNANDEKYPVQTDNFISALWDGIVMPTIVLIPDLSEFPLLDVTNEENTSKPMVEAWSKFPEYGMMYSAFAIPIENCSKFITAIDSEEHKISTLLIRYLRGQQNTTCLTFASSDSCIVDVYDLQSQNTLETFHTNIENLVNAYGGTSHWGKYYVGGMKKQIEHISCYNSFKEYRKMMDPGQKFVNDFTQEMLDLLPRKRYKKNGYNFKRIWFVVATVVSGIIVTIVILGRSENNRYAYRQV